MDCLVNFDRITWVEIINGMRCKTYQNGEKVIRLIELTEGFVDAEWCIKSHTNYILEGQFTSDFNGEIKQFSKGDVVYIPEGIKHKAVLGKGDKVVMLDF